MSAEAIQSLPAIQSGAAIPLSFLAPGSAGAQANLSGQTPISHSSFGNMLEEGLAQVNRQLMVSQSDLQQLAIGDAQNLHQIMIRLEESRISFQLLMQVRNRLLESYQEVMRMQV
jgi:flagellar hook-basal body complex protein FliE